MLIKLCHYHTIKVKIATINAKSNTLLDVVEGFLQPFEIRHPSEEYLVPYFTKRGDGPLGAMSGFEAIGNVR